MLDGHMADQSTKVGKQDMFVIGRTYIAGQIAQAVATFLVPISGVVAALDLVPFATQNKNSPEIRG